VARAGEPPAEPVTPCRGDACADIEPQHRVPLLVPARPPEPEPPPEPPPHTGRGDSAGPRISFGRTFTRPLVDGFYGRIDTEVFTVEKLGLLSLRLGLEGWGSRDGGGGGIPWAFEGGLSVPFTASRRSPYFVLAAGLGWEWLYYDRLKHVGQFGIFAPIANAYTGIDVRGVRLFAEVSAQYRWGWGGPDHAQYRAGASISINSELWDGPRE
jgi:hypothetical protein